MRQSHVDPSLEPSLNNDTRYAKYLNSLKFWWFKYTFQIEDSTWFILFGALEQVFDMHDLISLPHNKSLTIHASL